LSEAIESEEVKTYPELVKLIRIKLENYLQDKLSSFRDSISSLPSISGYRVEPRFWFRSMAAVDAGSFTITMAEKHVSVISALAILRSDSGFRRRIMSPMIIEQRRSEKDHDFMKRVDMCRESLLMKLAEKIVDEKPELILVDGPLISIPLFEEEYLDAVRSLIRRAQEEDVILAGFVKRPQSEFIASSLNLSFMDSVILSSCLKGSECYPWPAEERLDDRARLMLRYTYLKTSNDHRILPFRIDFPSHVDEADQLKVLSHIMATCDPVKGVPAMLLMVDEEVKLSRRLIKDIYQEAVERLMGRYPRNSWGAMMTRWGEFWL